MQNILSTNSESVLLNSALNEELFAKTKFSLLLDEKGYIVQDNSISPWLFTGTKTIDDSVYFTGSGFTGKIVEDLIFTNAPDSKEILFNVLQAYTLAFSKNIALPLNGLSGISYDEETKSLLFVPQKTFDKCAANQGKITYEQVQNVWKDQSQSGTVEQQFTQAVIAYYALTRNLPYPANPNQDKVIKISQKNFLPLEYSINGINKTLAKWIDNALCGEENKNPFPLELFKNELFEEVSRQNKIDSKLFEENVKAFVIKQQKTLNRKRLINKNLTKAIIACVAVAFISICVIAIMHENGKKPCVIGLSSKQTVEVFYTGIHHMDTDYMLCSQYNCIQAQRYISQIPQIYVASQMQTAFNFEAGLSTPENWLFYEPDTKKSYSHYIYGITNFTIDDESYILNPKVPTKKNHPHKIIKDEQQNRITEGENKKHTVRYYLVHNEDGMIRIDECTTFVTLEFIKSKWQIINLDEVSSSQIISPLPFSLDYKQALDDFNHDEIKASNSLRDKYSWIPTEQSLIAEKERLDKIGY